MRVLTVGELLGDVTVVKCDGIGVEAGSTWASGSAGALHLVARPGGSPANVAVALARLGVSVGFAGRLSSSGVGPWLAGYLSSNGVDLGHSVDAREAPTLAFVSVDTAGVPTYVFYGAGTADWQWRRRELPRPDRLGVAAVHTGSLAATTLPGCDALAAWAEDVRARGAILISYDPNVRISNLRDRAGLVGEVGSWVKRAHLVKASEDDLRVLDPGSDVMSTAQRWARLGPELVVITRGAQGSIAFRPDGSGVAVPASSKAIVDTVGAGDAFCAGLLAWLSEAGALHPLGPSQLTAKELRSALVVAGEAASFACTRPGADPPWRATLASAPWP